MSVTRSILRKPMKSLLGIILMALGVAVICTGVGQYKASDATATALNNNFDTVAVLSGTSILDQDLVYEPFSLPTLDVSKSEDAAAWAAEAAKAHPDIIMSLSQNGLASAYIRDMRPISYYTDGYTWDHIYHYTYDNISDITTNVAGSPQCHAMLAITLEEIGTPQPRNSSYLASSSFFPPSLFADQAEWLEYRSSLELWRTPLECVIVELSGKITQVLSLEESFGDPTGMTLRFTLSTRSYEEMEALLSSLEVEGRYLVYGLDYYDTDWELRKELEIDEWGSALPRLATEEEKALWRKNVGLEVYAVYKGIGLDQSRYNKFNSVSLTGDLTGYDRIRHDPIRDENGDLVELREISELVVTASDGARVTVSTEEYAEYYKIPSIVSLKGTAEEFLASEEGAPWREALERDAVNDHAFPVIGVDDLGYVAQFAFGDARIAEGREFIDEELTSGARVCVISQELATANGLAVGDTIHPNFYNADENLPYQSSLSDNTGLINPSAGLYFSTTPLLGEMEYTIVGIYRCDEPWAVVTDTENHYAFTPNTVFVPKASVPSQMQYSQLLQFQTVVIHNGRMEEFAALMNKAGYGGFFHLDDQGYSLIAKNFTDYSALSGKVLLVSAAACGIVSLLYLLLFPGSQRKTMLLMESLGAGPSQRFGHVFLSSLSLLLPATLLGTGAAHLLWDGIIAKMKLATDVMVEMEPESTWLLAAAAAHFLLMALLSAFVAVLQARPHKLTKRR